MSKAGNNPAVTLFTDGACRGNPGPGGWGVLLRYGDREKVIYGYEPETTNNRMELQAVIEGLRALKRPCRVQLNTDSRYVMQGLNDWMPGWKRNGWKTAAKKAVKNQDLWQALDAEVQRHDIDWRWVRGHSGVPGNERADELANRAIDERVKRKEQS
jgi:ribonuclease HI